MNQTLNQLLGQKPESKPSDKSLATDHRGAAITTCAMWSRAKSEIKCNRRGLYSRSRLITCAQTLQTKLTAHFDAAASTVDAGTQAAHRATADWILETVRKQKRYLRNINHLERFFWGYLERTASYADFFRARLAHENSNPARSVSGVQPCMVGFAYGAPSLGALADGSGLKRGWTQMRGRGRDNSIGINDQFWSILAKNKEAHYLLALASKRITAEPGDLSMASTKLQLLGVKHGLQGGPQFIVQRAGMPRMRLHLRFGKFRGSATSRKHFDEISNQPPRQQDGNPFHLIEDLLIENFVESENQHHRVPEDRWGQYDHLCWCLEPVSKTARRNSQLFA